MFFKIDFKGCNFRIPLKLQPFLVGMEIALYIIKQKKDQLIKVNRF